MKHTPAPWIHWEQRNEECELQSHICQQETALIVARLDIWKGGSKEEQEANARLIAAAPELLEALQYLVANLQIVDIDDPDQIMPSVITAARAAIAKATA